MIPQFDSCIVCEQIREELQGKLILQGFFGVCPHVDVSVAKLDQPTALTFLFAGGVGDGTFTAHFDIVDASEQPVAGVGGTTFVATPATRTNLATTFLVIFGRPGLFAVRCIVDNVEQFRGYFRVGQL